MGGLKVPGTKGFGLYGNVFRVDLGSLGSVRVVRGGWGRPFIKTENRNENMVEYRLKT